MSQSKNLYIWHERCCLIFDQHRQITEGTFYNSQDVCKNETELLINLFNKKTEFQDTLNKVQTCASKAA